MTRLILSEFLKKYQLFGFIFALAIFVGPCRTIKLIDMDTDGLDPFDIGKKLEFSIESGLERPKEGLKPSYSDAIKWSQSAIKSEFLDQDYELITRRLDLNAAYKNLTVLLGTQSTFWVTGSQSIVDSQKDLFKFDFKSEGVKIAAENINSENRLFLNKFNPSIGVFTDSVNKKIKIFKDNGKSLSEVTTPFHPNFFYFTPDESIVLAAETNKQINNLWISFDYGQNWKFVSRFGSKSPEWEKNKDLGSLYLIDDEQTLVKFDLKALKTEEHMSQSYKVIKPNVLNFQLFDNNYLFTTSLNNEKMRLEICSVKRKKISNFELAEFKFDLKPTRILDYKVIWADKNEILVVVIYELDGKIESDLFRTSDFKKFIFQTSLTNIVYDIKTNNLDIRVLNQNGGVLLANVRSGWTSDRAIKTMIRTSPGEDSWTEVKLDPSLKNGYLDLISSDFMFSHEYEQSSVDDPKSPDFAIAPVINQNGDKLGVYGSRGDAKTWSRLLKGIYSSSYANYGHILLGVDNTQPVNEIIYSLNKGNEWIRMKFTDERVLVDQLITISTKTWITPDTEQPLEQFLLIATHPDTKSTVLFRIDAVRPTRTPKIPDGGQKSDESETSNCKNKCRLIDRPDQSVCLNDDIKCNGKIECFDYIDELDCKGAVDSEKSEPAVENESPEDEDKQFIPSEYQLKSFPFTDRFKVNIDKVKIDNLKFSISFSVQDLSRKFDSLSDSYAVVVQIIQIPSQVRKSNRLSEASYDQGEIIGMVELDLESLSVPKSYDLIDLDAGFDYVCRFLINLKNSKFDQTIFRMKEEVYFNTHGYEMSSKPVQSISTIVIIGLTVFATVSIIFVVVILHVCLMRKRARRTVFPNEPLDSKPNKKTKMIIFRADTIGESHQSLIRQNSIENLNEKIYASTMVM